MAHGHDMRRHHEFHIELFVFPDGESVELMVFDGLGDDTALSAYRARAPEPQAPPAPPATSKDESATAPMVTGPDARVCPLCGSELVYPLDWRRESTATWTLLLRCPDCETVRDVLMDRPSVEELNRALYHAHQAVAEESKALTRRNFEEEAERIVAALDAGLIQPMDF